MAARHLDGAWSPTLRLGRFDQPVAMQSQKGNVTTHLLRFTVGPFPIQPVPHAPR